MYSIKGKYSTARIMTDEVDIEPDVYKQILSLVNCPVFTEDSCIMPDYHYGKGAVIGFTAPMTDKVIPNVVGVDIGCNMLSVDLGKFLNYDKARWLTVDRQIRRHIPMAQKHRKEPAMDIYSAFPWALASWRKTLLMSRLSKKLNKDYSRPDYDPHWFFDLCKRVDCKPVVAVNSIGSLGGGNHFIEFGTSERTGNTRCTIHSGSRNLGLKVANYWQRRAKEYRKEQYTKVFQKSIEWIKKVHPRKEWDRLIRGAKTPPVPTGLEYLEGEDMCSYLHEMAFCQFYAQQNLSEMMLEILRTLNLPSELLGSELTVHTTHNYIDFEDFIVRKGAVASYKGRKMIIPFNMEDGLLICEGKSNPEWNYSAPHGAGRMFGRKEMKARKDIDTRDVRNRMNDKGIYLSVVPKDEVKEAYKDPQFVEDAIEPTATIYDRVRPVLTLKADD